MNSGLDFFVCAFILKSWSQSCDVEMGSHSGDNTIHDCDTKVEGPNSGRGSPPLTPGHLVVTGS